MTKVDESIQHIIAQSDHLPVSEKPCLSDIFCFFENEGLSILLLLQDEQGSAKLS